MSAMRKRLIEELIPLAQIGQEASKSVSYGAIHAIHTWFARRPLAACRAATFAALVDAPKTEQEREALFDLIIKTLPEKAPQELPDEIEEMRRRIRDAYGGQAPRVLDPFAGGGSLPLEAARLGCEAHALDLNPVAVLTLLATVDYPMRYAATQFPLPPRDESLLLEPEGLRTGNLVEAVRAWGDWLLEQVRHQLEPFYPPEPDGGTVVAYLWAKTVRCTNPACGAEIPLVAHRWLSQRKARPSWAYEFIRHTNRTLSTRVVQGDEAERAMPSEGTMTRGATRCLFCPQIIMPDEVKAQAVAGQSGRMLLAVAYVKLDESGTFFRPATDADRETSAAAEVTLGRAEAAHDDPFFALVPDEPFPPVGALGIRPSLYGIKTWGQMHSPRQLLSLTTFCRGVRQAHKALRSLGANAEEARAVSLYLALAVSRMVLRSSECSRWNNRGDKAEAATAGHRLAMVWDYAEVNPLGGASGSWDTTTSWAIPSVAQIMGAGPQPATVKWGDAAHLPYPDNSFDAVLTDPPYYDSVPYSYLADMQYVWLHRALQDVMPEHFAASLTPKTAEIIQDPARHDSDAQAKLAFEQGLCAAMAELRRVLKPDGVAMVMYAHTATSAWETLVNSLVGAGLQVTASWPVETEQASRREWLGGAMLAATIFLVCRKREGARVGYLDEMLPAMRLEVKRALARFWAAGIGGADFFISAIGPALSVYSQYAEVRYASGQVVSVASFLTLVRQAVVDYSLEQALHGVDLGEVDRETQFALLWRWTYGNVPVETGAAMLLDKATGVELGEMERRGLVGRSNGSQKMALRGPHERPELLEGPLRQALTGTATLVDAIHCAAVLWRDNRRDELAQVLAYQSELLRRVAQALAELQPESSTERRLILGFLGSWDVNRSSPPPAQDNKQLKLDL